MNPELDFTSGILLAIVKYYHRFGFLPTASSIKNDLDRLGQSSLRVPHSQINAVFQGLIDHGLLTPPGPFTHRCHLTNPEGFDWFHSEKVSDLDTDYLHLFARSL